MKQITISTLFDIKFLSSPLLSPSGQKSAFVVSRADPKNNCYESGIWLLNGQGAQAMPLTSGKKEGSFIWEDDGSILFSAQRAEEDKPKDGEEKTAFYRILTCGGEAQKAFELGVNAVGLKPAGGGKYVALALCDLTKPKEKPAEDDWPYVDTKDYHVIEEMPLWGNGRGWLSRVRMSLYLADPDKGELTKLTDDLFDVRDFDVKDGKLLVTGELFSEKRSVKTQVLLIDLKTLEKKTVVPQGDMSVTFARFCGSGIVLAMNDGKKWGNGQNDELFRGDAEGNGLEKVFSSEDILLGPSSLGDMGYGRGSWFAVDGDDLYVLAVDHGKQMILKQSGKSAPVCAYAAGAIPGMLDAKAGRLIFAGAENDGLTALYELADGKAVKAADPNEGFLDGYALPPARRLAFTDSDGVEVEGWVIPPANEEPGKKYPGVLEIHGGPRGMYTPAFFHEMRVFSGAGYYVFFCNPRGSSGYGEAFADLRGKYGTIDYADLMEFTDAVLEAYPAIDPGRLCAAGGSYGGFMCNWIEGHTDRFRAIASQRSISNWPADFGTSEIGLTFDLNEMGTDPWTDVEKMWEMSPLKYADRAKTPILFIHSLQDYNCTLDQGVEMFAAMKYFGVPSRMCLFEGENHSLSRTGKPRHRARRLKEMLDWFEKYCGE